jgi:hypothetical protein
MMMPPHWAQPSTEAYSPNLVEGVFSEVRQAALLQVPLLRCGGWLFTSYGFGFHDLAQPFLSWGCCAPLAIHLSHHAAKIFELYVKRRVFPLFTHLLESWLA